MKCAEGKEETPLFVAQTFTRASILLGVGLPLLMGSLMALGSLLLYPLAGPEAWDPFFAFISDSYLPLGLAWLGLAIVSVLLFVAALLEVRESREPNNSAVELALGLVRRISKPFIKSLSQVYPLTSLYSSYWLTRAILSARSGCAELNVLIMAVGLTSIARRLQ